jgi:hypothetical protein
VCEDVVDITAINNLVTSPDLEVCTAIASSNESVNKEIALLSENISDAVMRLSETISSLHAPSIGITSEQVYFAVFIAFIGAFSAYLFNLFHWNMVNKKQRKDGISITLSVLVGELESISVTYWLNDYDKECKQKIHATEIAIKSKIRLIVRYIGILSAELNSKKLESKIKELDDFRFDIFELVTGDEFESASRIASKAKAIKISNRCSDVKAMISSL